MEGPPRKPSNLALRFAIGIPAGIAAVWFFAFGNLTLLVFVMVASWLALREFWRLTGVAHHGKLFSLARLGELATVIFLYITWAVPSGSPDVLLAFFLPLLFIVQLFAFARGAKSYLHEVAVVALGVLYIGGFLSFIFRLRELELFLVGIGDLTFSHAFYRSPDMIHLTIFPVLGSWCYDTSAFFAGKYFGSEKLAPSISPKKTIAGLIGGMMGSATGVAVYSYLIGLVGRVPLWELIVFGAAIGAFAQLGDLTVSALKREAQMKDSGRLLGAHGGMLDRIDGFLFAVPGTYIFFMLVL